MGPFAGLVTFGGRKIRARDEDELRSIVCRRRNGNPEVQSLDGGVFVQCGAGGRRTRPGTLFVADARLDNDREAAAAAGLSGDGPELIEALFAERGETGIASLLGAFAFAH